MLVLHHLLLLPLILALSTCVTSNEFPAESDVVYQEQFNIVEASGMSVTSVRDLPRDGFFETAAAHYNWELDGGKGQVRIAYWATDDMPSGLKKFIHTRPAFEERWRSLVSDYTIVGKPGHPNGAEGFVAFGKDKEQNRCAVGTAILKLDNAKSKGYRDSFVEAAICSSGTLLPNTMDNLIWYLRKAR
ncbi:hypothetical protein AUP42_07180 [Thalassospira lucentensis]|uniref:DUF3047 domain-containing protein n=1 Tax=Thalassospira lucentensis TaxID=168935 RepID=A0A154L0R9_9PROT|nr:hypothetical protein AUP42_07180 [Thalassospira lucentensis]